MFLTTTYHILNVVRLVGVGHRLDVVRAGRFTADQSGGRHQDQAQDGSVECKGHLSFGMKDETRGCDWWGFLVAASAFYTTRSTASTTRLSFDFVRSIDYGEQIRQPIADITRYFCFWRFSVLLRPPIGHPW